MAVLNSFTMNTAFGTDEIHRYLSRGVDYLYITREDFEQFNVTLGNTPFLSCLDQEGATNQDLWKRTQEVFSALLLSCGINERALTARHIHPLSSIFIFAHDLVEQLYAHEFDPEKITQIMNYMGDKYNESHFESAYSAFLEVFKP